MCVCVNEGKGESVCIDVYVHVCADQLGCLVSWT